MNIKEVKNYLDKTTVAEYLYTNCMSSYLVKIDGKIVDLDALEARFVELEDTEDTFFPVKPSEVYEILDRSVDINFLSLKLRDSVEYLNRKIIRNEEFNNIEKYVFDSVNTYNLYYRVYKDLSNSITDNINELSSKIKNDNKTSNDNANKQFKSGILINILISGVISIVTMCLSLYLSK